MPLKNIEERKKYAKAQYVKTKEAYILRSKARRLKLKMIKALLPKQERALLDCITCGSSRENALFPMRGNKCKPCVSIYNKEYREKNVDRISLSKKSWSEKNKEHKTHQDRLYAINNPEARKAARKKWEDNNPGKTLAAKVKNKADRLLRVPHWLTKDDYWMIEQAYEISALRTKMFGFQWHVDHIIPLKGRNVSGLHVPHNLRVIPAIVNTRKSNKFEVNYA